MANLPESNDWVDGIYQLETTTPAIGGPPNETTLAGVMNVPAQQLAKRTRWLRNRYDELAGLVVAATTSVAGLVRLTNSTTSTSTTTAATPAAVKQAMDNANGRAPSSRTISAAGLATGGGDFSANRTITVQDASQAEAEAGAATNRAMSPLRVAQAIANRMRMRNIAVSGLASGGGNLDSDLTITVPVASQVEAEAGVSNTRSMTPLRTAEALAADRASYGLYHGSAAGQNVDMAEAGSRAMYHDSNGGAWPLAPTGGFWWVETTAIYSTAKMQQAWRYTSSGSPVATFFVRTQSQAGTWGAWERVYLGQGLSAEILAQFQARSISTSGLAQGGGNLSASRTITVPAASLAEAEAGTDNSKAMTPLRVMQAIINRMRMRNIAVSGLASGGGNLDGDLTITVPVASQAEAEAGVSNARAMTPLRTQQAVAAYAAAYGDYSGVGAGVNINTLPAGSRGLYHDSNGGSWPIAAAGRFWWIETRAAYTGGTRFQEAWHYSVATAAEPVRYSRMTDGAGQWGPWSRVLHASDLAAAIGNSSSGQVGSYAICRNDTAAVILTGGTVAGSSLRFTGAPAETSGATAAGTWRCMSNCNAGSAGLFLRIA